MPLVEIEDRGAVRHIVLARAEKRNALNRELIEDLGEAVHDAAAEDSVRVVVVRGDGPMFSSGMDLADLSGVSERPRDVRRYRGGILAIWNLLEEMPKATICQIHGACLGGAMELALACDMRVMAEDAGELVELFGGETGDDADKFDRCGWSPGPEGIPVLDLCRSWFAGRITDSVRLGDHVGFVLEPFDGRADYDGPAFPFSRAQRVEPGHEA